MKIAYNVWVALFRPTTNSLCLIDLSYVAPISEMMGDNRRTHLSLCNLYFDLLHIPNLNLLGITKLVCYKNVEFQISNVHQQIHPEQSKQRTAPV